jgi:hypothetical protein
LLSCDRVLECGYIVAVQLLVQVLSEIKLWITLSVIFY